MKYYKITNETENHKGLYYKTGLNIDPVPFNPSGDCEDGGIYFAREDILSFLEYGPYIREVILPADAQVYKNPGTPEKWKADRVILGERRKITVEVVKELIAEGAKATDEALNWAAGNGHLEVVKVLIKAGAKATDYALIYAARNGHLKVVKVLLSAGAKASEGALNWPAYYGHLKVVKVLLSAGAKATDGALNGAAFCGHLEIVKVLKAARKENKK